MTELSCAQRGLLQLCRTNPGPSLAEMYLFAPLYRVSPETLRADLIALLDERLLAPLGTIDPATYFPVFCEITEQGKAVLKEGPPVDEATLEEKVLWLRRYEESNIKTVTETWPTFGTMPADEVMTLAETYLFWAEREHAGRENLLLAAARGFGHLHDPRRFVKAIRKALAAQVRDGDTARLAATVSHLLEDHPHYAEITLAAASLALAEPYRRLTGRQFPYLITPDDYERMLREFFQTASRIGGYYAFHLSDGGDVVRIRNRIEDILGEAFRTSNRPLFQNLVHLLEMQLQVMGCLVTPSGEAAEFEERAGFRRKVSLAMRATEALEGFSDLVLLAEPERAAARDLAVEIFRLIARLVFAPLGRIGQFKTEKPGRLWVLDLVGIDEIALQDELLRRFERLAEFRPGGEEGPEPTTVLPLPDTTTVANELNGLREMLRTVAGDTAVIRYVQLPAVEEGMGTLLDVARRSDEALREVCRVILESDALLRKIDAALAADLPALRADVERWLEQTRTAPALPEAERHALVKALGEMVKLSNAGKLVCSIPLIPGFLQYRWEFGASVDLNRWLERVVALFRRGGE